MRQPTYMVLACILGIGGCTTDYIRLAGPPESMRESRNEDMRQCRSEASATQRPLDAKEEAALKGRSTRGFLRWTDSFAPSSSVVDRDGHPATAPIRFGPPQEISNRYVLCLLERGYRWDMVKSQ